MNMKYLFIYKMLGIQDGGWSLLCPWESSKFQDCLLPHISFRVKFEDERPVQQAARMLGLEVEAEKPLILIQ